MLNKIIGKLHVLMFGPCVVHFWEVIDKEPTTDWSGKRQTMVTFRCINCAELIHRNF